MKTFVIDTADNIAAVHQEALSKGQITFTSEAELAAFTSEWPAARLVEIWNQLPGVTAVRKFTDRKSAVARIWKAVQALEAVVGAQAVHQPAKKPRAGKKPKSEESAPKANKSATVLNLLRRAQGATTEEIMSATGWQAHSVRGFLSGVVGKRMGLSIHAAKRENGKRAYSLAD